MRKLRRLLFRLFLTILLIVVAIVIIKTVSFSSQQIVVEPIQQLEVKDEVIQRLSDVIQIPTTSFDTHVDTIAFLNFFEYIDSNFILVDSLLEKQQINQFSRIYKWEGRKSNLPPFLLMAHLDVVPVEGESQKKWTEPPYSGKIKDGFIWGRGSMDDKMSALSILETVEILLKNDYYPNRTFYIAFGHDEEVGGIKGAKSIANFLADKKIMLDYVLDEGSIILENAMPGLTKPLALIGTAEKGYVTLELSVNLDQGGHSSMPPQETAIGILSSAITKLQNNPLPAKLNEISSQLFIQAGPEMNFPYKTIFANLWLFEGILINQLSKSPSSNAMMRTTTAPTIIHGGIKDNVLPTNASASINFRIIPDETVEFVLDFVKKIIDDERIQVEIKKGTTPAEPSPISNIESFGYNVLQKTSREIFPDAVVVPSLVIAQTDSRHFNPVCENIFRFTPIQLTNNDLKRIHGIDERISVENYKRMIRFYHQLILNSTE